MESWDSKFKLFKKVVKVQQSLSRFTPKCSRFLYFLALYVYLNRGVVIKPHYNSYLSVHIKLGVASEKILLDTTGLDVIKVTVWRKIEVWVKNISSR